MKLEVLESFIILKEKAKTNRDSFLLIFPRFESATSDYFEF